MRNLHGVSRIKKTLCTLHRDQRMLFDAQVTQMIKVPTIPREMCVTIAKARHQCPPFAVQDTHSWILSQSLDIWHFAHSGEALPCSRRKPQRVQYRLSTEA